MKVMVLIDGKIYSEEPQHICPKCSHITLFSHYTIMPRYCNECRYDLSKPISWFRQFTHRLFWAFGVISLPKVSLSKKYPLAHYVKPTKKLCDNCEYKVECIVVNRVCKYNTYEVPRYCDIKKK